MIRKLINKTLRPGHTYRIHDLGPLTVACAGSWICDGSHRWPKIDVIFRDRWTRSNGRGGKATIYRRVALPLPYIRWYTAYKYPVLRPIQRRFDKAYRFAFDMHKRNYSAAGIAAMEKARGL